MNKNGVVDPYENWKLPINDRINDLLSKMTKEEKTYQMFYNGKTYPLSGFDFGPAAPEELYSMQNAAAKTRLGIPNICAGDTTIGYKTTYPIESALAAAKDYNMVYKLADMQRKESVPVGYRGVLSPVAEIGTKVLYPRIQEGGGEDAYVAASIIRAMVVGLQGGPELNPSSVLVTVKHWPSQGAGGESGITYDNVTIKYHMIPWRAALEAGAGSVMPGYAGCKYLDPLGGGAGDSTPILKYLRDLGFKGVICTDWLPNGVWVNAANAGSDVMGGANPGDTNMGAFANSVSDSRVDDAVRKILEVKFKMGLFETPYGNPAAAGNVFHTKENDNLAIQAARGVMTLLKNNNTLPLNMKLKAGDNIVVAGDTDTAGNWMPDMGSPFVVWTSFFHEEYGCKTIWDSINEKAKAAGVNVYENTATNPKVAIVVAGERSYTHGTYWPKEEPYLPAAQLDLIKNFKAQGIPVVVVLIMPRPYVITEWKDLADAIVVAYRPGDGGGTAVGELLFGEYEPTGKLPWQLPRSMDQVGTDVLTNQLEMWDLPYDLGATAAERAEIRSKIDAGIPVPPIYGNPLYQFGSGIQGFGLNDSTLPSQFGLSQPANAVSIQNVLPSFSWNASGDAETGIKRYEFWMDGVKLADVNDTKYSIVSKRILNGTHSWYIVAVNWAGGTTKSNTFSFNFQDTQLPNAFNLLGPDNGTMIPGTTTVLNWQSTYDVGSGLDHYEIWMDNNKLASVISTGKSPITNNLALGKAAYAASTNDSQYAASKVTDGDLTTRWESQYSDPQWVYVDLGETYSVSKVILHWETAYSKEYKIQVSNDTVNWKDVYSTVAGAGGVESINIPQGYGRYVRIYTTKRATGYGNSLFELEVFGNPTDSYNVPALSTGTHTWYAIAVDAAGNRRQSTNTFTFTVK